MFVHLSYFFTVYDIIGLTRSLIEYILQIYQVQTYQNVYQKNYMQCEINSRQYYHGLIYLNCLKSYRGDGMSYFDMNVSAALIILSSIVIRRLTINKVPQMTYGILWALGVLRLVLPFSVESKLSVFNLYYNFRIWMRSGITLKKTQSFYIYSLIGEYIDLHLAKQVFMTLWFTGIFLFGLYFFMCYKRDMNLVKDAGEFEDGEKIKSWLISQGFKRKVKVLMSCEINGALSSGLIHSVILLPTNFRFDEDDIHGRQVILHEYMHIKYFHSWIKILVVAVLCVSWFNPLVWTLYIYICRDMEISCDRHVLEVFGREQRKVYALNILHAAKSENSSSVVYSGFARSKSSIKERVIAIMNFKKLSAVVVMTSLAIPFGVANVFATTDNKAVGSEFEAQMVVNEVDFLASEEDTVAINVEFEDLQSYATSDYSTKAVSSIDVIDYTYVTYGKMPPSKITVTSERNGYTYKGTLTCTDINIDGDKYTGYYSGTIYRQ